MKRAGLEAEERHDKKVIERKEADITKDDAKEKKHEA